MSRNIDKISHELNRPAGPGNSRRIPAQEQRLCLHAESTRNEGDSGPSFDKGNGACE